MKLYHYSKQLFDVLKTLERQRSLTEKERREATNKMLSGKPGYYYQHISFFLEPPPFDIMGDIFGNSHHTWHPGSVLFQYEIESSYLGLFKYEVVESPEKTALYYDDSLSIEEYVQAHKAVLTRLNYVGSTNKQLEDATKHLLGTTRSYFEKLSSRPNWKDIKDKYAPTVPHLMLYPASGIIRYENVRKVAVR